MAGSATCVALWCYSQCNQTCQMYRNPKLLRLARLSDCKECGADDGTIVAAHSNQGRDGKGMGMKSSDAAIAFICHRCHTEIDQGKEPAPIRLARWEAAHRATMRWLIEEGHLKVA